jgi:hypothetical protein
MSEYIEQSDATQAKARLFFTALLALADNPGEAAAILLSLMVNLWLSSGNHDTTHLDEMLATFADGVRTNIDMARTNDRRTAN